MMRTQTVIGILAVMILLAGGIWWRQAQRPSAFPLATEVGIDEINFDVPGEFEISKNQDDTIAINLRSDIENIINFSGRVRLFKDFDEYQKFVRWPGYVRSPPAGELQLLSHEESWDELAPFAAMRTKQGDGIVVIGFGDAGSMSIRYLVLLNTLKNTRSVLVEMERETYEDPIIWGTREEERLTQHRELERIFEEMVRTLRFN